jgi:predicted nucleic acid-binding protein
MPSAYLDSSIVVYAVENSPAWGPLATSRLVALRASGAGLVVSDLVRLECSIKPLALGDRVLLQAFYAFFALRDIRVVGLTAPVCNRAAEIRARYRFETPDALHLAAAVESGCDVFLTNDAHLSGFPELTVELLR